MKKFRARLVAALCFFFGATYAQTDSLPVSHFRISVLTCAPGDELYSIFGHSAIRVVDSVQRMDIVYNYGMFDFGDPDFYTKFANGKLDYFLGVESFSEFMLEYQSEKRGVTEQVLALTALQKEDFVRALNDNLRGSARFYRYDFTYDNCTTRIRDLLTKYGGYRFSQTIVPPGTTYRDMLHVYLDRGAASWSKLGIDMLLSLPADRPVTSTSALFLPDYLMKGIENATHDGDRHTVDQTLQLNGASAPAEPFINWPLYVFSLVALIWILFSVSRNAKAMAFVRGLDFILFFFTGIIGIILLYLWLWSDHTQYRYNFNLLWALPTHFIASFFRWRRPVWLKNYFRVSAVIHGGTLIAWYWLPQPLNVALVPVVILLLQRCVALAKK